MCPSEDPRIVDIGVSDVKSREVLPEIEFPRTVMLIMESSRSEQLNRPVFETSLALLR